MRENWVIGAISGSKRVLVFERPKPLYQFVLGEVGKYQVLFHAMKRQKECEVCGKEHEGGAYKCPIVVSCGRDGSLNNRLARKPVIN